MMNSSSDGAFFTIAFGAYLIAWILFLIRSAIRGSLAGRAGVVVLGLGGLSQTIALVLRWASSGHPPLSSMHEYASVMSWMVAISLGWLIAKTRRYEAGSYASPILLGIMAVASLLPKQIGEQLVPALQSYWLYIHVSLAALAEGAFAVSCALAILYLARARRPGIEKEELERLDGLTHRMISIGYPLFTLGALFAGAIWAYRAWGSVGSWDPKEVGSWIIWLFYTGYLHARYQRGWRGTRAMILAIVGFATVILSFLGNLFLGGQHAYG